MSSPTMDRDFLVGVFAVQLGFATPGQVMAAASAWLADPSRSIPERLVAEGVLDASKRGLLERFVADALRLHDGDVPRTLHTLGGEKALFRSFGGSLVVDETGDVSLAPHGLTGVDSVDDGMRVTAEHPGRYELRDGEPNKAELGRGGMGRVLVALDTHLGREIAIKELLAHAGASAGRAPEPSSGRATPPAAARFLREARVTGQLEHPNIMPVYELGARADGTLYYTMKLVRGRTLAQALSQCKSAGERLKLLPHYADLCHAMAYAHSRGVIHRDIKTENVMLGEFGETVVLDWGLAKVRGKQDVRGHEIERKVELLHDGGARETLAGGALGTPAYMSPEQADGAIDEIDERSDVWSLGAVLFEILTGRPPFEGVTPFEIMGKVLKDAVPLATEVEPRAPPELAAVAAKALEREKARRYQGARQLAEETDAYTSGERVAAYRYGAWEVVRAFVEQNRALSALVLAIVGLVLTSSVVLYLAYRRAGEERTKAEQREQQAQFNLAMALQEKADRLFEERRLLSARVYSAAALVHHPCHNLRDISAAECDARFPGGSSLRTRAISNVYQTGLSVLAKPGWVSRDDTSFLQLAVSADGQSWATLSQDSRLGLWDASTRKRLINLAATSVGAGGDVALSPDGKLIAACRVGTAVGLWDRTGKQLGALGRPGGADCDVAFSPTGRLLASTSGDGRIILWDVGTQTSVRTLEAGRPGRTVVAFSPADDLIAAATREDVLLWDTSGGERIRAVEGLKGGLDLSFSPDGQKLAVGTIARTVEIADVQTGKVQHSLAGHLELVDAVDFSSDGKWLVSASRDKTLRLWDGQRFELRAVLEGHEGPVVSGRFLPDSHSLISAGEDGTIRSWLVGAVGPLPVLEGHSGWIWNVDFSPDGSLMASAGDDGTVRLWDVASGRPLATLETADGKVTAVSFSGDGKRLASCRSGGGAESGAGITVWDVAAQRQLRTMGRAERSLFAVQFSPDGRLLASRDQDGVTRLWDPVTGEPVADLETDGSGQGYLAFSPDGRWLATGGADKTVRLWDVAKRVRWQTLSGHSDVPNNFAFSPEGGQLLSCGKRGTVLLWDVATGRQVRAFTGHGAWVNAVAFVPGGKLLATASDDWTVRLWDQTSGEALLIIKTSTSSGAWDVAASPHGNTLAVVDGNAIKLFPLDLSLLQSDPPQLLDLAQNEARMKLEGFAPIPLK